MALVWCAVVASRRRPASKKEEQPANTQDKERPTILFRNYNARTHGSPRLGLARGSTRGEGPQLSMELSGSQLPTLRPSTSALNSQLPTPNSQLPTPTRNSQLVTPNSQLPTPNSQLPTPNSQLPTPPNSRLPQTRDSQRATRDLRLAALNDCRKFSTRQGDKEGLDSTRL